jgi:hypothetical protein
LAPRREAARRRRHRLRFVAHFDAELFADLELNAARAAALGSQHVLARVEPDCARHAAAVTIVDDGLGATAALDFQRREGGSGLLSAVCGF